MECIFYKIGECRVLAFKILFQEREINRCYIPCASPDAVYFSGNFMRGSGIYAWAYRLSFQIQKPKSVTQ